MEQRLLGRTGVRVSHQTLGAMMFGTMGNTDRAECVAMVHRALDAGITTIDTADAYSRGQSEEIVGEALVGRRDDVVLATKVFFPMGRDPNQRGGSRRWIVRAVEDSLRRLRTDHIDVYQLHRRDPDVDLEESLAAMSDLVRAGKVRVVGMSATGPDWIVEGQWIAERRGLARVRCEQAQYSLFARRIEAHVLPACRRHGLGVLTYGPLNGGFLSGKYRRDEAAPADSRAARPGGVPTAKWDRERAEVARKFDLLEALEALAAEAGLTLLELAMGFVQEHPDVSSVIIGPRTPAQLEAALAAADVRLDADLLDGIDRLLPPGTDLDRADSGFTDPELEDPRTRRR